LGLTLGHIEVFSVSIPDGEIELKNTFADLSWRTLPGGSTDFVLVVGRDDSRQRSDETQRRSIQNRSVI